MLLGAAPIPANKADSVATRVLLRGEPVDAPPGRADDFTWPRRDVATTTGVLPPDPVLPPPPLPMPALGAPVVTAPAAPRPFAAVPRVQQAPQQQRTNEPWWRPAAQPQPQQQPRAYRDNSPSIFGNWFGR